MWDKKYFFSIIYSIIKNIIAEEIVKNITMFTKNIYFFKYLWYIIYKKGVTYENYI